MKQTLSLTLTFAFLLLVSSRVLQSDENAVTPDTNYNGFGGCGHCITSGYTYCTYKPWGGEHQRITVPDPAWQLCRQGEYVENDLSIDGNWVCSAAYSSRAYAKYICFYDAVACGSTDSFELTEGET